MSYGITSTGFVSKDLSIIVADLQNKAIEVFGQDTDLRATNPLMIYINMVAQDTQTQWNILADMYANMFIITATGTALDQLAVDRGIQRQSAVKSNGVMTVTASPATVIPGATIFSTSGDSVVYFESTGQVEVGQLTETFSYTIQDPLLPPYEITLVKQATGSFGTGNVSVQIFPDDLTEVASSPVGGEFSCDYADPSVVTLGEDPLTIIVTVTYYDNAATSDSVNVETRFAGEAGNVGPAQVNTLVSVISGVTGVTNSASITGGIEEETDANFRVRLVDVPVAEWTEADLESVIENINGIKTVTVDDGEKIEVFTDQSPSYAAEGDYWKVDLTYDTIDVFRVTFYDDSAGTRTDFVKVVSDPSAGEYSLDTLSDPDQLEFETTPVGLDTGDTLTVTYMDSSVGVGIFAINVVADAPPLTSTLIDAISNVVKTAKPFGVSFKVVEPTFSAIGMTITLILDGVYSLSDVTPSITSGITAYIDSLAIGDSLFHYGIVDVIMHAIGIVNIDTIQYFVQGEEVTRGATSTDSLLHVATSLPSTIIDENSVTYDITTDYILTTGEVDWSPGGSEPAQDVNYTVLLYNIAADTTVDGQTGVKYTEGTVGLQE